MHSKGLCHRDLKPGNIILRTSDMKTIITDFSVSKCYRKSNGEIIKMNTFTGTQTFCAPEVFLHGEYT